MSKQQQVSQYARNYISPEFREKFYQLMYKWDGSQDYRNAFYDVKLLKWMQREAEESFYD